MKTVSAVDDDIATLRALIDGPDAGLDAFLAARPYLHTPDEARDDLARLIVGLDDVRAGRVVSHAQIQDDLAARRHGHGMQAAE
jgi:hypothetical protein